MEAMKGNINSVLNGFKQFNIPVYQRTYSWEQEQCERLWNDIVDMYEQKRNGHFVGAIVTIAEQNTATGVQKFTIIDGQQRMTTLTLLLIALRDYGYDHLEDNTINPKGINGMCIQNDYAIDEEKYKMLLTQTDKEVLINLIERKPLDKNVSSRLVENYNFFKEKVESHRLSPSKIQEGIAKLQIVNIILDRAVDDAQLIFESLNSTGMDLSQSDLIRNYILMELEPEIQNHIYKNYWLPMEKLFDYKRQSILMDKFLRDYLSLRTGKIPNYSKVYVEFKNYHRNTYRGSVEEFCKELYQYAKYYTNMHYMRSGDKELDAVFTDIVGLQMEVSFPFLLKVYYDFDTKKITKDEFIEILRYCESYVVRRAISGIPTNSLNKSFMMMIHKIRLDNYVNSVKAYMILLDSYKIFPKNEQFRKDFLIKDIYNMRIRNYILSKLENYENESPINISNFTIEHILPRSKKLSKEWKECLGENWQEIQKEYVNTIGNLTLTGYTSEMCDCSFKEKLEMKGGFQDTKLRINSYLAKQSKWTEKNIQERGNKLFELAKKIWKYPELTEKELQQFIPVKKPAIVYNLKDYEYLNGTVYDLFNILNTRILNISSEVRRECKKFYLSYKADTNFCDIVPQKGRLCLTINMKFKEVNDPKKLCTDITTKKRWGDGEVEITLENIEHLDDVMDIILQAYNKQME